MIKAKKYSPYLAGLGVSLIFGLSFTFTSKGLEFFDPITLIANRFLLASIFSLILILFKVVKIDYKNKPIKKLIYLALAEPIFYFIFETYGIELTNASISGLMIALIPIIVLILGVLFLKEKPGFVQWFFVFLSVLGAIIIVLGSNANGSSIKLLGFILLWGAVVCAALFNILSKYSSKEFSPIEITFFMMWLGGIFFGLLSLIINKGFYGYILMFKSPIALFIMLYLGVISSVLAFFLGNYMISKLSVPRAAVFTNLVSVVSLFAGVFIRGEKLSILQVIGAIIILIGVFGINLIPIPNKNDN